MKAMSTGLITYFLSLIRFSPLHFFAACGLNLFAAILSGVGLLAMIPLLHYAGWLPVDTQGGVIGGILMRIPRASGKIPLYATLGFFILLIGAISSIEYTRQKITSRLRLDFLFAQRQRLNAGIARARWSYILTRKLQHTHHMVTTGLVQISSLTYYSLQMVSESILLFVYLALSFVLSFELTLFTAGLALILLLLNGRRRAAESGRLHFAANRRLQEDLAHFLDGIKLAKGSNFSESYVRHFEGLLREEQDHHYRFLVHQGASKRSLNLISAVVFSAAFLVGFQFLNLHMATLVLLLVILSRLMPRVSSVQQTALMVANLAPVFREMQAMLDDYERHPEPVSSREEIPLSSIIRMDEVSYTYPSSTAGLRGISCSIRANETTAIIGASGAGKTTLADILLGLLIPQSGRLSIDGVGLNETNVAAWRVGVGYVPQEPHLFHDTVRANLTWANPGVSDEAIWEVLETAAAAEFVHALPDRLNTVIGDKGGRLSGGERQRLALARALLRRPHLLLMDEATSAVDPVNESLIHNALRSLHGKFTIIFITHRESTLHLADQILVMNAGILQPRKSYENVTC